ncbi:nucleotidyltransferase family protein [Comamonadaceae bacterium OH2545_COT-014]|nr:nucleotidyltransferase family protein [Comamonadaceae bacterium OH2545_COT-014]
MSLPPPPACAAGPAEPAAPAIRAMLLAAGRGERMRPLTDRCPKPLLPVQGRPLLQWPLQALAADGVREVVINTAWLDQAVEGFVNEISLQGNTDGPKQLSNNEHTVWPPSIMLSHEARDFGYALETAGGIARALPLLAPRAQDVFWVAAGDIFAPGFRFDPTEARRFARSGKLAHLWLVPNPPHHPAGDFGLSADGLALNDPAPDGGRYTFSTIALYRRALFEPPWCAILPGNPQGTAAPLAPLLRQAIAAGQVSAALYTGAWTDVGTPERLAALNHGALPAPPAGG